MEDPAKELRICRQLLGKGVTAEQIQNMEELGYTAGQILAALDMCETTEDRQFFGYLMDGTKQSYGQAFAIDPDQLSDGMSLLMADYACHLVPFDPDGSCLSGTDRLIQFNNALLGAEYGWTESSGNRLSITYRDVYLDKMCTGTTALLLGDAEFLSYMDTGDEGYQELYTKYLAKLALNNLWAAEDGLLEQSAGTNEYGMPDVECRITDLKFENAAAGFSFEHVSLGKGGTWTETVDTSILWTGDDIERDEKIKWLQKAGEEKEQAVLNLFRTLTKDVGIAALGIYAPELAVLVSGLSMVMDGKAGLVTGLPSVVNAESSLQKLGVTEANTIAKDVLNGITSIGNAEKGLNQANYKDFLDWFGMGGDYRITNNDGAMSGDGITISFTGVYDPDTLRAKRIWEEKGMDAWIEWGDGLSTEKVWNEIDGKQEYSQEVREACNILLHGGDKLFNEEMDMLQFEDAIRAIDSKGELGRNSLELQFKNFVLSVGSEETK